MTHRAPNGAMPRRHPPLHLHSRRAFLLRVAGFAGFAVGFVGLSLGVGVLGYHHLGGPGWIDSLLNASMILTGMGPVDPLPDDSAKLFASAHAICGAACPATTAIVIHPFLHRMLNILHLSATAAAASGSAP